MHNNWHKIWQEQRHAQIAAASGFLAAFATAALVCVSFHRASDGFRVFDPATPGARLIMIPALLARA